jgi:hypothetical protein
MTLQQQIRSNRWRTMLLFILFAALVAIVLGVASFVVGAPVVALIGAGLYIAGDRDDGLALRSVAAALKPAS